MLQPYKKNARISGAVFVILNLVALNFLSSYKGNTFWLQFSPAVRTVVFLIFLSAAGWYYNYAKAKGYSGWLAWLGVFHIFGFLVMLVLPDRNKGLVAEKPPTV